jgi:hypothetical protein
MLADKFPSGITIVEHYSDYFKVKLDKSSSGEDASIGKLFGLKFQRSKSLSWLDIVVDGRCRQALDYE